MRKLAFITGGAGFLGAHLCKTLVDAGFSVICFGRTPAKSLSTYTKTLLKGAEYVQFDLRGDLSELKRIIQSYISSRSIFDELYFYNLAWSGKTMLSDLCISAQFENISYTQRLFDIVQDLNFHCFIHCGTMEEKFATKYTSLDHRKDKLYNRHVVYALAKLYSRISLKFYQRGQTNLVLNTNAHLIGPGDNKDSFLQQVILAHMNGDDVHMSSGEQLFDVINVRDCAKAYLMTARNSSGVDEYWIGSNSPQKLSAYVDVISEYFKGCVKIKKNSVPYNDVILEIDDFNANKLYNLGFQAKYNFAASVADLVDFFHSRAQYE